MMGIVPNLSLLALRQVVVGARNDLADEAAPDALAGLLAGQFGAVAARLMTVLHDVCEKAWQAQEISLAGVPWWERGQMQLTGPEDQPLREAVRAYLDSAFLADLSDPGTTFRLECARELRGARRAGLFDGYLEDQELAKQAALAWADAAEPPRLREAERKIVEQLAADLRRVSCPHLARLLEMQAQAGPTLLGGAARLFFRRAVEQDEKLEQALPWVKKDHLGEPPPRGLVPLADVMETQGDRLSELLDARGVGVETRTDGLDLWTELQGPTSPLATIGQEVLQMLASRGLEHRELIASDALALGSEDERRKVQQLSTRYRSAPEEQRRVAPALLNGLAKLEVLAGNFETAQQDFQTVAQVVRDPRPQAAAHFNTYLAALERRQWPDALAALKRAALMDPDRFAPFPMSKYEPEAIVRNDAFGVGFLCKHRTSDSIVRVKALRPEVIGRTVAEVFREVQTLETLEQAAILRLRDCDFADVAQTRPFFVHDHFEGLTLTEYVEQHGPFAPADFAVLMRPVIEALQAAHARGVLHRDLRPVNILIRKDTSGWRVKLVNFALSLKRSLLRTALIHSPARFRTTLGLAASRALEYNAPEQLGRLPGAPVGAHSDIYSLGKTCYYALLRTGDPDDEEKESLPVAWRKLLGHCTSFTVNRRLQSLEAVVQRLAQQHPPEPVARTTAREPEPKTTVADTPVIARGPKPAPEPPAKLDPAEAAACVQRGVALRLKGEFDAALGEFNKGIKLDPKNALAYEGRGNTYVNKTDYDRAIADYSNALQLDPTLALVHVNRGLAYVKKKDAGRAIADYTAAIKLDAKLPLAYLNRGSAYARRSDYDRAIMDYTAALQLDSKMPLAYFNRGLAQAKKGQHESALADYNKALELDPKNAHALTRRQEALQALKRPVGATAATPSASGKVQVPSAPRPAAATLKMAPAPATETLPAVPPQTSAPRKAAEGQPVPPRIAAETKPLPPKKSAEAAPAPPRKPGELPIARQVRLLEGHTDAVRAVAFSPDGRRALSGSDDKTVRVWDIKAAKKIARLAGHTLGVTTVAFSPTGERVLSGSQDHTIRLWDIESGEEVRRFGASRFFGSGDAHSDAVVSVAFSPDGLRAISASWDKTLRLWDVETGKEVRSYVDHSWPMHSVVFSPDGQHFLFGSEDKTARLCEVETGQEVHRFEGHTGWVLAAAFSPDGRHVLTGGADGTMRLWNVSRGKEVRTFGKPTGLILVQCIAFSPDGKLVISGEQTLPEGPDLMRLYDAESGAEITRMTGHQQLIWSVAFSPDGRWVLSGSADQTLRVWKLPK